MKLSIIIPVYNEEATVLELIKRVENVNISGVEKEIIIVNDGSTDNTKSLLEKIKTNYIIHHPVNKGMGHAFRTGLSIATGDYVIKQDADLEYPPENYQALLGYAISNNSDVVYGSRFLSENHKEIPLHYYGNKFLTVLTNILNGSNLTDMETCYKLIRLSIIKSLNLKAARFDLEPEITTKLLKRNYKITEVPIIYSARKFEEGKKITWVDGIKAVYYLIRYKLFD